MMPEDKKVNIQLKKSSKTKDRKFINNHDCWISFALFNSM